MENNYIIHSCEINGNGKGIVLEEQAISTAIKGNALTWVHLDANVPESRIWLEQELTYLDNIIINALLVDETRPRTLEFDEGALMIFRGMNLNEDGEPEDMISVRLWVDAHRIITVQRRPLKAIKDIQGRLKSGKGPKNAGDFVTMLSAHLFERMEPVLTELDERTDNIEERVLDCPSISERQEIVDIRKQAIMFRRYIAPQRDVMTYLRTSEMEWLDQMHKRRIQESLDRVVRYVEDLDAIRERAQIVKDELGSVLADKLNKNMYVLSVVAAIFLPLGFLTSLMGINTGGIPGIDNENGFWIFSGMLAVVVTLQTLLFKKLKWF